MVTEFQKTKLAKLFWVYDWDGSNSITNEDFEIAIDNLRRVNGIDKNADIIEKIRQGYHANWLELKKYADTDGDGKVTLSEWYTHNVHQLETEGGYDFIAGEIVKQLFALFDKNKNGIFSLEEYKDFCWAYRLRGFSEAENFKRLCPEGEGLNQEQFLTRIKEFFGDDPDAPGNFLFGPL